VAPTFAGARQILERAAADRAFPAAVVEVGSITRPLWREAFGHLSFTPDAAPAAEDTVFDLASLTKVLVTTPLVIRLVERGRLGLDDPVAHHLATWRDADASSPATLRDLLSHCSGLPDYAPLFEQHAGRREFEQAICSLPLAYPPRSASIYSDLGFILLGFILDDVAPLPVQFDALKRQMGGAQDLQFSPPTAWHRRTAPTRADPWRGRVLTGEVDDNNAWALGGVAGHAGLFGTAEAVGEHARHLLQVLSGRRGAFDTQTARMFVSRRSGIPKCSRALGWDTMLLTSSCGVRMSPQAFGHTGFTGTSLWIDPVTEVYVVLLTNRVHPTPDNEAIKSVRPAVHDAVLEEMTRE
jgi:CubicO group peptidase (beta-lactamase class C family)